METILIVDDVQTSRELIGKIVSAAGHRPEYASDGDEALERAKQLRPALIFMDVELMRFNGVHVCKSIKENLADWKLPVVLTSAHSQAELEQEAHYCHADAILPKPFTTGAVKRLAEHFAGRYARVNT